jgi:hypothetical protein
LYEYEYVGNLTLVPHFRISIPPPPKLHRCADFMELNYLILISALAGISLFGVFLLQIGRRPVGYPPGPPTRPLIGNALQVQTLVHVFHMFL